MRINTMMFLEAATESTPSITTALLNTVMGISIVFIMLIVISFVISLFKYISKIENYLKNKKTSKDPVAPVASVSETTETAETVEDLSDDLELVSVITAAIHAYEESMGNEVPADGLVVRSIRKVNKSRWQNA